MPKPRNQYKVTTTVWDSWHDVAKELFNTLYFKMRRNQAVYLHKDAASAPLKHWHVTAWNAAWMAAALVDRTMREDHA